MALRGLLFVNSASTRAVISIKGTTPWFIKNSTAVNDRLQDNLMFSCCCGMRPEAPSWLRTPPVCSCSDNSGSDWFGRVGKRVCNEQCLTRHALQDATYLHQATDIFRAIRQDYPQLEQIFLTGHSLGGALAALLAAASYHTAENKNDFDGLQVAAVTFAAPGMALFAQRLGLIQPKNEKNDSLRPLFIWNFGVDTDPIYQGACHGLASPCYLAGYTVETKCRLGFDCPYQQYTTRRQRQQQ